MLIVLMMVMLAARLILWFVLVLHQIAILVVVGFAPLLIAGACGPRPAAGYAGATELLVALVFTKTAIFAISLKAGKAPVMAFAPTHSPGAGRGRHEMARHTAPHASGHDQPTMTTADAPRVTACEGTNNSGVPAADVADPRRAPRRYAALPTRDAQDSRRS